MFDATPILKREFDQLADELRAKHEELEMRASGDWMDSLDTYAFPRSARIDGLHYTNQLVSGRAPGRFPPIRAIEQWIEDKGIAARLSGDITVSSLAYLIARKIATVGTDYFIQGGTDLVDAVITPARMQEIVNRVGAQFVIEYQHVIVNYFKDRLQKPAAQ